MKNIIKKTLISEKADALTQDLNRYTFIVDKSANKLQIKSAIESLYNVNVRNVHTMTYGGGKAKTKHTAKGISYQRNKIYKKAIISLAEGETIDLF